MVSRVKHNHIAMKLGLNTLIQANNDRFGSKPSSINGDAYEALIGAIYLDKGYKFAQKFILNRIINVHIDMEEVETKEVDFKSKFIEWAQKEKKEYEYETVVEGTSSKDKQFVLHLLVDGKVVGEAQHFSKRRAEQMVSEQACIRLKI
jgi:ribonuclease-3